MNEAKCKQNASFEQALKKASDRKYVGYAVKFNDSSSGLLSAHRYVAFVHLAKARKRGMPIARLDHGSVESVAYRNRVRASQFAVAADKSDSYVVGETTSGRIPRLISRRN